MDTLLFLSGKNRNIKLGIEASVLKFGTLNSPFTTWVIDVN